MRNSGLAGAALAPAADVHPTNRLYSNVRAKAQGKDYEHMTVPWYKSSASQSYQYYRCSDSPTGRPFPGYVLVLSLLGEGTSEKPYLPAVSSVPPSNGLPAA